MRALLQLLAALLASVLLYGAVFSVVHRPLTVGEIAPLITRKAAHLQSLPTPRVVILAGSNGRFSHRCQPITQATGLPCSNLSVAVGLGLDFQLQQFEPLLRAGDVVYMPLEYSQYAVSREEMQGGAENALLVHDFRSQLQALPWQRQWRAWSSFDLPFLVHGLLEMGLAQRGTQRRGGVTLFTDEGDQRGHTEEAGLAYREFLASARFDKRPVPADAHGLRVVSAFLDRTRERGVKVIGGWPTTPDTVALDEPSKLRLRQLFESHGQRFLELPGRSQYPMGCFFDTLYHLNEPCQLRHSAQLGLALNELLKRQAQ